MERFVWHFRSVLSVIPGVFILTTLACFSGLVVFAYYASIGCDPLANGDLSNPNQVLASFFKLEVFTNAHFSLCWQELT